MISPDSEMTSKQILLENLEEIHYSQQFLPGDAVISLSSIQRPVGIGYDALDSIFPLLKYRSYGIIGRIHVNCEFIVVDWHRIGGVVSAVLRSSNDLCASTVQRQLALFSS